VRSGTRTLFFLFDKEIQDYLESLRRNIVRLRMLQTQEKAADEAGDEEKRQHLVDLAANVHLALSNELPTMIEKFKHYLRLGNITTATNVIGI
jgi:hypothetical protein